MEQELTFFFCFLFVFVFFGEVKVGTTLVVCVKFDKDRSLFLVIKLRYAFYVERVRSVNGTCADFRLSLLRAALTLAYIRFCRFYDVRDATRIHVISFARSLF